MLPRSHFPLLPDTECTISPNTLSVDVLASLPSCGRRPTGLPPDSLDVSVRSSLSSLTFPALSLPSTYDPRMSTSAPALFSMSAQISLW